MKSGRVTQHPHITPRSMLGRVGWFLQLQGSYGPTKNLWSEAVPLLARRLTLRGRRTRLGSRRHDQRDDETKTNAITEASAFRAFVLTTGGTYNGARHASLHCASEQPPFTSASLVIQPRLSQLIEETGVTGGDVTKVGYYAGLVVSCNDIEGTFKAETCA
jgi:hypothetical protein